MYVLIKVCFKKNIYNDTYFVDYFNVVYFKYKTNTAKLLQGIRGRETRGQHPMRDFPDVTGGGPGRLQSRHRARASVEHARRHGIQYRTHLFLVQRLPSQSNHGY